MSNLPETVALILFLAGIIITFMGFVNNIMLLHFLGMAMLAVWHAALMNKEKWHI